MLCWLFLNRSSCPCAHAGLRKRAAAVQEDQEEPQASPAKALKTGAGRGRGPGPQPPPPAARAPVRVGVAAKVPALGAQPIATTAESNGASVSARKKPPATTTAAPATALTGTGGVVPAGGDVGVHDMGALLAELQRKEMEILAMKVCLHLLFACGGIFMLS